MKEGSNLKTSRESYSLTFAFIYFFNLHLGQGIITIPKLISKTGLLLSTLLITAIAGVNFITSSFVLEAMGIANALKRKGLLNIRKTTKPPLETVNESADERTSLLLHNSTEEVSNKIFLSPEDYEITEKFEMGDMANMFYYPVFIVLYYVTICLYITGSLATVLVVIVKTLVVVVCADINHPGNCITNTTSSVVIPGEFEPQSICFGDISQQQAYYIFLSIIAVLAGPWAYFRFTSSRYLQLLTNTMRNIAYALMLGICIAKLSMGNRASPSPPLANVSQIPALFGITTYIFKSQHCLPGVITPIKQKRRILLMISTTLIIILGFHLLMSYTAVFWLSYDELQELYTLNFFAPYVSTDSISSKMLAVFGYYIVVYPVFALTPIIPVESIIMRENLKSLTRLLFKNHWLDSIRFMFTVDRILLPTVAIVLPLAISFSTTDVDLILSVTGGVFGVWIQYLVSTTLLFAGKYIITRRLKIKYENKYKSPFSHIFFLVLLTIWTVVSAALVMAGDITRIKNTIGLS